MDRKRSIEKTKSELIISEIEKIVKKYDASFFGVVLVDFECNGRIIMDSEAQKKHAKRLCCYQFLLACANMTRNYLADGMEQCLEKIRKSTLENQAINNRENPKNKSR